MDKTSIEVGKIWINGSYHDGKSAVVHLLTHSLHYGSSAFEGVRCYGGKVFKSVEHAQRLKYSCDAIGMPFDYTDSQIHDAVFDTVKANGHEDCYVRPLVWYGTETMGVSSLKLDVNFAVVVWKWPQYYADGIKLNISRWKRPPAECAPVHAKISGLYVIATMTKNEAEREGCQDGLMMDYRGYISECSSSNIFFVIDGEIHTPTPDCFLNGITRQTVIKLAKRLGYTVRERHMMPDEIHNATEAFVTGTAGEVTRVSQIADKLYKSSVVSNTLRSEYMKLTQE